MNTKITWFEIYVDDMDRAKAFYEAVFETELELMSDPSETKGDSIMYRFPGDMESYGSGGALAKYPGYKPSSQGTLIYFECENCALEESRVEQAGGKIVKPKESIGGFGFISLIQDTEGNMIGLHSMK